MTDGEKGEILVQLFHRSWERSPRTLDLEGVDFLDPYRVGRWGTHRIQVKWDNGIEKYERLLVEFFEKSPGRYDQPWRVSPHNADEYVYLCEKYEIRIPADALAALVCNKPLTAKRVNGGIAVTTMAVFIPLDAVRAHRDVTFRERR